MLEAFVIVAGIYLVFLLIRGWLFASKFFSRESEFVIVYRRNEWRGQQEPQERLFDQSRASDYRLAADIVKKGLRGEWVDIDAIDIPQKRLTQQSKALARPDW